MSDIEAVLGSHGPLTRVLPDFQSRPAQLRMAERIRQALERRELLLVEAGTGTGKTYAYLVPALLSGLRVLISTGTRTLQDQLYHRDLPLLSGAIGRPVQVSLLKGRSNYLCRARLADLGRQSELLPAGTEALDKRQSGPPVNLDGVLEWARVTPTGDLAELPQLPEQHPLRGQLSSTRESCTGMRCSEYAHCHVFAARRAAMDADIVVVNHHLLLADLALKEDGFGDLLPSVDAVILDEAHQLPDLASEFFGVSVSSRQIELLLSELRAAARLQAVLAGSQPLIALLMRALQLAQMALGRSERHVAWRELPAPTQAALLALGESLGQLQDALQSLSETEPALQVYAARVGLQVSALHEFGTEELPGARTVSVDARGFALRLLPYDIAARFRGFIQQGRAAWIFTSATLAVGQDFSHFAGRLGLGDAQSLCLPSPFDFERQALLYLPTGLPAPSEPQFTAAFIEAALPLLQAAGGGAFVLFTSHRALRQAAELLAAHLGGDFPLLIQGSAPREQLLRRFRASGSAILLGSASFWEGVDVQGPALRLVIIDKLPFASPEDPVVRARIEHLTAVGANPFRDYQLPEAVLTLKQGVGRLIRSERDERVVMIGDPRLSDRPYGRLFRASLPPMPCTRDVQFVCERLAALRPEAA
jgi:ATP-dependent DNA helicase DinG